MDKKAEYLAQKQVYLILFSDVDGDINSYSWLTDINSLISIKTIVAYLAENNYLNRDIRNRIYKYLDASREIKTDNFEERVNLLNEIKVAMNMQKYDESYLFYILELAKRRNIKINKKMLYTIDEYINEVNNSIAFDYLVLEGHDTKVSDDEFQEKYLTDYANNPLFYYESLNAITNEMPDIIDDLFIGRVKQVLDSIYKNNKYYSVKQSHKKILKKLHKRI